MFWLCIALMLIGFILDLELPECVTLHYTTYNKRLFNSNSLALSVVLVRDLPLLMGMRSLPSKV